MRTLDEITIKAPLSDVFRAAASVERWPEWLPHYRWIRSLEPEDGVPVVEMAAWRPFGPLKYPTWWVSKMWVEEQNDLVRYHHIAGITKGMDVEWRLTSSGAETRVVIEHRWHGPAWPLIRWPAANLVIGPVFIHGIASRTLAGIRRVAEADE